MKLRWTTIPSELFQTIKLTYGPLTVELHRDSQQWIAGIERNSDTGIDLQTFEITQIPAPSITDSLERIVVTTEDHVESRPLLADRPMVVKPNIPFKLPSKKSCKLYISTPVWLSLHSTKENLSLIDTPILQPSDTWFGPNSWKGELCYATRTRAFVEFDESLMSRYRAISLVNLINKSSQTLSLERISLPVPYLSVYRDKEEFLWTEPLTVVNEKETGIVSLQLDKSSKSEYELLSKPRKQLDKSRWVRTINSILG